jgi:GNAT superfamily N-acetyltransferase
MDIIVTDVPDSSARELILTGLIAYNEAQVGPSQARPLAVLVQDEGRRVLGGLWAWTGYGWLSIELLFLPPDLRGRNLGRQVMRRAEEEARSRGCREAWLDTFGFQAKGFYERLGYTVFGQLDEYPQGSARYFMKKAL